MSSTNLVHIEIDQSVATVFFNDPARRNAMTAAMGDALSDAVHTLRANTAVRAVVLAGAGGTFSGGGDLAMLEQLRSSGFVTARDFMLQFYRKYLSVTSLPVPTIAAVEGAAIGAGLCVALACDLTVMDQSAKLALNFAQLGLHPGMGATYLLPRRVGAQRAAELLFTGRRFDGREALAMGLCLDAVEPTQVLARAQALARQIATSAPLAVRGIKESLAVDPHALDRALDHEAFRQAESYASRDLGQGLAAAAARTTPLFEGA
ncbi:MAG: enoyl-CoA hydratase/isomerase family protein [Deltaproteobacteria bacterium]|nr:enoyl-CoA hydratase/isomerase family protein [Deltaproteobacteria bacterium]